MMRPLSTASILPKDRALAYRKLRILLILMGHTTNLDFNL